MYACDRHVQFACGDQVCHIGDALAEDAVVPGGFAGLVVDLFADGQILPALREVHFVATAHTSLPHQSPTHLVCAEAHLETWFGLKAIVSASVPAAT